MQNGPNTNIVLEFFEAWSTRDLDHIMRYFAKDALYHNIPMDPAQGHAAIREMLAPFIGMAREIEWVTHAIAETEQGQVLSERTDWFLIGEHWVKVPVMGIIALDGGGRISLWKDYFDLGQFQAQLPKPPPS